MTGGFSSGATQITSAAYLLACLSCALASFYRAPCLDANSADTRVWLCLALLLGLIAVNTLTGADQTFVLWLRRMARADGWYEWRRPLQVAVLVLALAAGMGASSRLRQVALRSNLPTALAFATAGTGTLTSLAALRLVSYHYADQLMNQPAGLLSLGRWAELAGLVMVWLGAVRMLMVTYSLR